MRGDDGVEQVDCGVANGIVAVDIEKLTGRTVEAVEKKYAYNRYGGDGIRYNMPKGLSYIPKSPTFGVVFWSS